MLLRTASSRVLKASRRFRTMIRRPATAPSLVKAEAAVVAVGAVVGAGEGGWVEEDGGLPRRSWVASQTAVAARATPRTTPARVRGLDVVMRLCSCDGAGLNGPVGHDEES